jgi:hypothetical protein
MIVKMSRWEEGAGMMMTMMMTTTMQAMATTSAGLLWTTLLGAGLSPREAAAVAQHFQESKMRCVASLWLCGCSVDFKNTVYWSNCAVLMHNSTSV